MRKRVIYYPQFSVEKVSDDIIRLYNPDLIERVNLLKEKGFIFELSGFTPYGISKFPTRLLNEIRKLDGRKKYIITEKFKLIRNTI